MTDNIVATILKRFSGSKWANADSAKHKEACALLEEFDDSEIIEAIETLGQSVARTFIKPEELVGEIRRNRKRIKVVTVQQNEQILAEQVAHDRAFMVNALISAPSEAVAAAVKYLRKVGVIGAEPLSRDIQSWRPFTVGMVYAAYERNLNRDR